jgi:photosystem II stability/assembly factor-like uncharacterized protein
MKVLILVLLLFVSASAQNRWMKLSGPPGGNMYTLYIKGDTLLTSVLSYKTRYKLFSSFNRGESWQQHTLNIPNVPFNYNLSPVGYEISDNYFFFATYDHGIFRSTDLTNWEKLNISGKFASMGQDYSGNLYLGTESYDYDIGKIYQSSDGGDSWKIVYASNVSRPIRDFILRPDSILLVSAGNKLLLKKPDNPQWDSVIFGFNSFDLMVDDLGYIYVQSGLTMLRSSDDGLSWVQLPTQSFFWDNEMVDYIYNTRIIGAFVYNAGFGDGWGAAVSDDRGSTWRWSQQGLPKYISGYRIEKDGNDTYLATNWAGIFKSTDFGESWFAVNNGINAASVRDICFDKYGNLYAASMKNGIARSTDKGESWEVINSGITNVFGMSIVADTSGVVFAGTAYGVFRSTDKGESWIMTTKPGNGYGQVLEIDSKNRLYALTSYTGMYRSTDLGESWIRLGQGMIDDIMSSLAIDKNGYIYAGGSTRGKIFKSTDDGLSWEMVYESSMTSRMEGMTLSPNGSVFAANKNEGLLRSTDEGQTWTLIRADQQNNSAIYTIAADPEGNIFSRTHDAKIILSKDNGETWIDISDNNLLNVNKFLFRKKEVYLATDESVWKSNPDSLTSVTEDDIKPKEYFLSQNYPNPFNPSTTIKYSLPQTGRVTLSIYDLLGREVVKLIDEEKPPGEYETQWNASSHPSGVYFIRMQAGEFSETRKVVLVK